MLQQILGWWGSLVQSMLPRPEMSVRSAASCGVSLPPGLPHRKRNRRSFIARSFLMSETMTLMLTRRTARSVAAVSLLCLLLCVVVAPQPAAAQVLYGSITGTVTDPSGASLPNAAVQALNTGTGMAKSLTTDDRGAFLFSN